MAAVVSSIQTTVQVSGSVSVLAHTSTDKTAHARISCKKQLLDDANFPIVSKASHTQESSVCSLGKLHETLIAAAEISI